MIKILSEISTLFEYTQTLLNDAFLPLRDDQREVVEMLQRATRDLEKLWMPQHFYEQLPSNEQSRWHHDMGNPLNGLIGLSELLLMDYLPEPHRQCIYDVHCVSNAILTQIRGLRVVSTAS